MTWTIWPTLACAIIALACHPVPDQAVIQTAYEQESSDGSALHDAGLRVLAAKCHEIGGGSFLCEVTFTSLNDPTERLYFDIVAVVRLNGAWALKSGLCKR